MQKTLKQMMIALEAIEAKMSGAAGEKTLQEAASVLSGASSEEPVFNSQLATAASGQNTAWWQRFFDNPNLLPPRPIDPAYVRQIFHEANYVQPIAVPQDGPMTDVELFSIPDANYYIFRRKKEIVIPDYALPGALMVSVYRTEDYAALSDLVDTMTLSPQSNPNLILAGRRFDSDVSKNFSGALAEQVKESVDRQYQQMEKALTEADQEKWKSDPSLGPAIYLFFNLPPGSYLAEVRSAETGRTQTVPVDVHPNEVTELTVILPGIKTASIVAALAFEFDDENINYFVLFNYIKAVTLHTVDGTGSREGVDYLQLQQSGIIPPHIGDAISDILSTEPEVRAAAAAGPSLVELPDSQTPAVYVFENMSPGKYLAEITWTGDILKNIADQLEVSLEDVGSMVVLLKLGEESDREINLDRLGDEQITVGPGDTKTLQIILTREIGRLEDK